MEEHFNPIPVAHLLQHSLRSLCIHENSPWVYAIFWRILPRNHPPPNWDLQGGYYDRSRGNRRNWYLVIEDLGFVVQLQRKFCYLQSIPGFLLPHPSSSAIPFMNHTCSDCSAPNTTWPFHMTGNPLTTIDIHDYFNQPAMFTLSMSSLEELLAKPPSVMPTPSPPLSIFCESPPKSLSSQNQLEMMGMEVAANKMDESS
ncbi:hypothetical protein L1049_028570 [Liquidambar formosana]|uniref:Transcription factor MYC/MYB N-terminal domain-containing protein n=1 Tax=Liquidambar formosana TaxID=63359 RepID=A0AAP0RKE6_LIQFO